ncbi:glycosyltransferase [Agrobacterium vitis]|uniref:glycosyltransferase n=1 Tax=Rhizobium/Agrobacterium group TaxID=227290 RepID=UPI0012E867A3|nr:MULTISPECIES: glycosyltransferase [Rhizobium/Agrobacterium group]MCF1496263.1 glycosyltransferase [Allorhizobium ampelinum]MVA48970.1 glycosyltransferase [Agrobacterium vitis]
MALPLISVIVVVNNQSNFVEQALESVARQTYRNIETIVIDNGSVDNTADLAHRFINRHMPNAILVRCANREAYSTINQGIRLARGDYFNLLNSADCFSSNRIERCIYAIERTASELIFTDVDFVDLDGCKYPDTKYISSWRDAKNSINEHPTLGFALMENQLAISSANFFVSSRLHQMVGDFRQYRYNSDWDYILRSLFYTEPVFLSFPGYICRFGIYDSAERSEHIVTYETTEVMRNFIWLMTSKRPLNIRAPSPFCWPGVFERVVKKMSYEQYMPPRLREKFDGTEWIS